ncbi:MAG: FIST N-terminal domain-containing protein [Mucilaginibacter sp.]
MTESTIVFTNVNPGSKAGQDLGLKIKQKFNDRNPDVIIVFASSVYDYEALLQGLKSVSNPDIIIGTSSAGEFTSHDYGVDSACAVAISSTEIKFKAGLGEGIQKDRKAVAEALENQLTQEDTFKYQYHSAMIFADALSGYTDELIGYLTESTAGKYQFFGGGAGDNANFKRTHVFYDTKAYTDAAVILEMLSTKPIGVGISHGWQPSSKKMKVTAAEGRRLISLNARPAIDLYKEYAASIGKIIDVNQPIPFFLNNILGIEFGGDFKLRAPLGVEADGTILLASDVPVGSYVYIMSSNEDTTKEAAVTATSDALKQLGDNKPNVAIFFDCVATRLRMGHEFGFELDEVNKSLNGVQYAGCNTYGQVARVNGQFSGFQNCSAVVCVIPE